MTRVLVVTAVELEAHRLARQLGLERVAGSAWPHFRGGAIELLCAGPRAAHLETRAAASTPSLVVSAGVCGALSPDLAEGDLVVPEAVVGAGSVRCPTAALPGLRRAGTILTVAAVLATAERKARLWMETGALACDMESGPIVEWASARGLPGAVVRGVSDTSSRGVAPDLAAVVEPDGRVRTATAIRVVLSRPGAIAEAMTLRTGTQAALKSVAAALGTVARA